MNVLLANPRGFCAGVDRAIAIVEKALQKYQCPIYVRHEVVHNKFVVDNLREKGVIFVEEITEVPENAIVIFSAHGVSKKVKAQARVKKATVFDATCPLVTKVHKEVERSQKRQEQIILIGHAKHPEVEGTVGQCDSKKNINLIQTIDDIDNLKFSEKKTLSYITQTTLSVDDTSDIIYSLKQKYPQIKSPNTDDICYATQNRQNAVKKLINMSDMLIVIGSSNSSNSNRLKEIAVKNNKPSYLIDNANEIKSEWFVGVTDVGVTAGASAPEVLVKSVIHVLKNMGAKKVVEISGKKETTTFPLPKELR